jgi:hypothetical protein
MIPEPKQTDGFPSCISLAIEYNPQAVYYQTVEEWWREQLSLECPPQWVSEAEKEKAIAENSVWVCYWYPTTPIGSYEVAASSFDALMATVNAVAR